MGSFQEYASGLKLSDVKQKLLRMLWGADRELTSHWIKSEALLTLTGQKYFDRRLRELRDHEGLDIESKVIDGAHCWRLRSTNIEQKLARTYLTEAQKVKLFSGSQNACSICGKTAAAGIRGLQADHRIPLSRGGTEDISNWQPLCHECNVSKRRICQGCELECRSCNWAYPEKIGAYLTVQLPHEIQKVIAARNLSPAEITALILNSLRKELSS